MQADYQQPADPSAAKHNRVQHSSKYLTASGKFCLKDNIKSN